MTNMLSTDYVCCPSDILFMSCLFLKFWRKKIRQAVGKNGLEMVKNPQKPVCWQGSSPPRPSEEFQHLPRLPSWILGGRVGAGETGQCLHFVDLKL